ncbi:MAG: fucose synthetase family protein [Hyphomicrobiales bacterium]|nr:fucose synthetase family protein [Hyphomicrobiales bacterium]
MTSMAGNETAAFELGGKRVWVAGHTGMVGSALVRRLALEDCEILSVSHDVLDLTRQAPTERWMKAARPDVVVVAAARVGGIVANSRYPADFLYDNAMIALNVIRTAEELGVQKLLWLGSSCIYPRAASQPMHEDALLTGPLEPTNEAYAIAKIAGLKLAQACVTQHGRSFITAMPTNLYGPNDNFDPETSHVLPALLRKLHEAQINGLRTVSIWGSGNPLREFLHVDDLADACVLILKRYDDPQPINIGTGSEISIRDLALLVADVVGYRGELVFDTGKPDGAPRKLLNASKMQSLGWSAQVDLRSGVRELYEHWLARQPQAELAAL